MKKNEKMFFTSHARKDYITFLDVTLFHRDEVAKGNPAGVILFYRLDKHMLEKFWLDSLFGYI